MSSDVFSNDIVLQVGTKELFRLTLPGADNKVVAVQASFLPGDNRKLTDFTVQLAGGRTDDDEVTVIESHGVIGFAPNPNRMSDEDDDDDDNESEDD